MGSAADGPKEDLRALSGGALLSAVEGRWRGAGSSHNINHTITGSQAFEACHTPRLSRPLVSTVFLLPSAARIAEQGPFGHY